MAAALDTQDIHDIAAPTACELSPDGTRIVYVLRTVNAEEDRDELSLWMLEVDGGASRRLTEGPGDHSPAWSPDGSLLAWVSDDGEQALVRIMDAAGAEPARTLATLPTGASTLRWNPDGRSLALLAAVDRAELLGEASTVGAPTPVVVRRLGYKADGRGLWGTLRIQPHLVPIDGGEPHPLVANDWNCSGLEWHPDGSSLLMTAAGEEDADLSGAVSLYTLPLAGHAPHEPELFAFGAGIVAHAQWLRDGSGVLAVGAEHARPGHLHLLLLDAAGTVVRSLSEGIDRNVHVGDPAYAGVIPRELDDGSVLFGAYEGGTSILFRGFPDGREAAHFRGDPETAFAAVSVAGERWAAIVRTPDSFGEASVFSMDGAQQAVTAHGTAFWADRSAIRPRERSFLLEDGTEVPGWIIRDEGLQVPGPLLLGIHGGPHNAWSPLADGAHWYHQVLAQQGWTILLLNPIGSGGYGEEFMLANLGSWGHGDEVSFLGPVEALVAEGIADPTRLVVAGYSYGGYSVAWLTTRTDRFAAAIAGGMVADAASLAASDIAHPELYDDLGASPWGDAEALDAQSPYRGVGRVRTPTLILHGTAEDRCPVTQAEQWFTALRVQRVPVELVLYPGGSHLMILDGRPSHRADYQRRAVAWARQFTSG